MEATGASADPSPAAAAAPLETERLLLRPFEPADAAAIQRLAGDWEVARYTASIPHPYADGMAEAFIAATAADNAAGKILTFAVARRADNALVGAAGLVPAADRRSAELGYWIGRPFWGQGYATEAVNRLVRHAFEVGGYDRLDAAALIENRASARVLEKVGFVLVGTRRRAFPARGREAEVCDYVLSRPRWQRRDAGAARLVLVAAVALIDGDGRVLIARRPEDKPMAGLWEFPGGKVQEGETPEQALIRELKEELSIDVTESCLAPFTFASHRYEDFHLLMPLYVCRVWSGRVAAREGQELAWVRAARLADYPMLPADRPLVAMLRDLL